jgi:hypothetical protein
MIIYIYQAKNSLKILLYQFIKSEITKKFKIKIYFYPKRKDKNNIFFLLSIYKNINMIDLNLI